MLAGECVACSREHTALNARKERMMSKNWLCAIVTGAASGLEAATAGLWAKVGARIVVNYSRSQKEAEAIAEACRKAGAAEVVVVQGDVSRDEDCRKIGAAAAPWGMLDVLVNNAGTTKHVPHHDLDKLSAEEFSVSMPSIPLGRTR